MQADLALPKRHGVVGDVAALGKPNSASHGGLAREAPHDMDLAGVELRVSLLHRERTSWSPCMWVALGGVLIWHESNDQRYMIR